MSVIPGLVSATFRQLPAEEILDLCCQAGLKAIEWSENSHVMPGALKDAEQLKDKTQAAGLKIAAYGSYYRLGNQTDHGETFLPSLMSAKALGAPVIRVWAGSKPSDEVGEAERLALAGEARMIAVLAEEQGIKIAFEWHKNTLTDTNESAIRLLAEAGHLNLYCLWQPTLALSLEEQIRGLGLLGDRLLHLHIYYWDKNAEILRRPLSEGNQTWLTYLAQLDQEKEYFGLLEFVQGDTKAQLLEDAKTLHRLIQESGRG